MLHSVFMAISFLLVIPFHSHADDSPIEKVLTGYREKLRSRLVLRDGIDVVCATRFEIIEFSLDPGKQPALFLTEVGDRPTKRDVTVSKHINLKDCTHCFYVEAGYESVFIKQKTQRRLRIRLFDHERTVGAGFTGVSWPEGEEDEAAFMEGRCKWAEKKPAP